MSRQHSKILKSHEIVSCLNDILEDESDGEPFQDSDDDYVMETDSSSSSNESENTVQRDFEPQGN